MVGEWRGLVASATPCKAARASSRIPLGARASTPSPKGGFPKGGGLGGEANVTTQRPLGCGGGGSRFLGGRSALHKAVLPLCWRDGHGAVIEIGGISQFDRRNYASGAA